MTYLDWGCDPLREECESCLDAYCNLCNEEFKKRSGTTDMTDSPDAPCQDTDEPDCDHCDREKKPDCRSCGIVLGVCKNCGENPSCEFRISW